MICAHCHTSIDEKDADPCPSCGRSPLIEERYETQRILGSGGSGTTYQATDRTDNRTVAIKELPLKNIESIKSLELFEREAKTLRCIDHDGAPRYLDSFTVERPGEVNLYLVQELIDGDVLKLDAGYTEVEVLNIVRALCEILIYLHGRSTPIIHRDIKPSNVMRRPDGRLVLIDFGSVRNAIQDASEAGSTVAGTFGYMAPEQLRGVATEASDLYSVGALAVALLTGRDAAEVLDPIHPGRWQKHVSVHRDILVFLERLLQPDDERRLSSAKEAEQMCERLLVHSAKRRFGPGQDATLPAPVTEPDALERDLPGKGKAVARAARRDWMRLRVAEMFQNLPLPKLVIGSAIAFAMLSLPLGGLSALLMEQFLNKPSGAVLFLPMVVLWLVVAGLLAKGRRMALNNPWRHGVLKRGILQTWSEMSHWMGELREKLHQEDKESIGRDLGRELEEAQENWGKRSPKLIPVFEAQAYGRVFRDKFAQAADALGQALTIGRSTFGEEDIRYADQLVRYSTLRALSTGHKTDALMERSRGASLVERLSESSGLSHQDLLERAVDDMVSEHPDGPATHIETEQALAALRAWTLHHRMMDWLPRAGAILHYLILIPSTLIFFVLPLGLLLNLLVMFGIMEAQASIAPWLFGIWGVCYVAFIIFGGWFHRRHHKGSWKAELFPDFDEVWPADHSSRPLFIQVVERVWESPIRPPDICWDTFREIKDRHETANGDSTSGLNRAQQTQLHELGVFLTYYTSQLSESVGKLHQFPPLNTRSRATVLEYAALKAKRNKDEDTAVLLMTEAMKVRG